MTVQTKKYKKHPLTIEAYQWLKVSDYVEGEKRDVGYFRHPEVDGDSLCKHCNLTMHVHGWIDTLEGGHTVCPFDYIITGIVGEKYPCKPHIFETSYYEVKE